MSKEQIKLEAGQWYKRRDEEIVYCLGESQSPYTEQDKWIFELRDGSRRNYFPSGKWREHEIHTRDITEHLPNCTGFDWVPPKRPEAPEGWRWLEDFEVIQKGDNFWNKRRKDGEQFPDLVATCIGSTWSEAKSSYHFCWGVLRKTEPKLQLREGAWYQRIDGTIVGPVEKYEFHGNILQFKPKWKISPVWYDDEGRNTGCKSNWLVREFEPPQPKYRPFASLEEFLPNRDRFVCTNVPGDKYPELYRVNVFNENTFWLHGGTGINYARGLQEYRFADVDSHGKLVFSPFGVLES
jgi:hypothetical protein